MFELLALLVVFIAAVVIAIVTISPWFVFFVYAISIPGVLLIYWYDYAWRKRFLRKRHIVGGR